MLPNCGNNIELSFTKGFICIWDIFHFSIKFIVCRQKRVNIRDQYWHTWIQNKKVPCTAVDDIIWKLFNLAIAKKYYFMCILEDTKIIITYIISAGVVWKTHLTSVQRIRQQFWRLNMLLISFNLLFPPTIWMGRFFFVIYMLFL